MAGRTASNSITRYPGIQVETSALGLQIPLGWGTFRCHTNLVWYNAFKSSAQKAAAGKGGTVTTGYNYTASLIVAICEGPIDGITAVYLDANTYTNGPSVADPSGKGTALSQANLNLALGAIGQSVWSYLTTNFPSQAIGYSGLAIAYQSNFALDSGAGTPNFSFEVERLTYTVVPAGGGSPVAVGVGSTPDADPSLVITDFFQNTRTGVPSWGTGLLDPVSIAQYQAYCLAAGLILSPLIDEERSASDFLTEMFLATNSTCVWSEGLLKFIPYGDTSLTGNGKTFTPNLTAVYSLTTDHFIPKSDGEPALLVDIEDQSDAFNVVQLEYLDRTNTYNPAIALASDAANVAQYGMRRQDPTTTHVIGTPAVAAIAAHLYLQRTLYIRAQYKFTLDWMFALLEPGDLLELTDAGLGLSAYPVRIIQIDEGEAGESGETLDLICEDLLVGISNTPLYTLQAALGQGPGTNVDPGGVEANLLIFSDSPANAAYTKTNTTITADSTTDQYGLTLASTLVTNTSAGVHGVSQSITCFSGQNYIGAVCVKAASLNNYRLTLSDGAGNGAYMEFNASTGAIITQPTALGTGIVVAGAVNATLVSGIWQASLCVQVAATTLVMELDVNSATNVHSWTPGSAISAGYLSQFQLRQGVAIGVYAATGATADGPLIFNPPSVVTQGGYETWAAAAGGPNWGGANVWTSVDGTNYSQVAGLVAEGARYGSLTASYASGSDPDTTDTCSVDLSPSAGVLTSAADAVADSSGTLSLIDNELIAWSTATLTNPSRYNLTTYTRRGVEGTAVAAHSAGAPFVRLDGAPIVLPFLPSQAGTSMFVKFQSFNQYGRATQSLSDCIAYPFTPNTNAAGNSPNGNNSVGGEVAPTTNPVYVATTDPALAETIPTGAFWFDETNGVFYTRKSGAWVAVNSPADGQVVFTSGASTWSYAFPATANAFATIYLWAPGGGGWGGVSAQGGGGAGGFTSQHNSVTPGSTTWAGTIGLPGQGAFHPTTGSPTAGGNTVCSTLSLTANGGGAGGSGVGGTGGGFTGGTGSNGNAGTASQGGAATGSGGGTTGGAAQTGVGANGNSPGGGGGPGASGGTSGGGGGAGLVIIVSHTT